MKQILGFACLIGACSIAHAASVDTSDAGTIAAFQTGATVNTLEAVPTRTPHAARRTPHAARRSFARPTHAASPAT